MSFRRAWAVPLLSVLGTLFAWYLVEPIYAPDTFKHFEPQYVSQAYWAVTLFLLAFLVFFFGMRRNFHPRGQGGRGFSMERPFSTASPDRLAYIAIFVWLVLLSWGTFRVGGDIAQALFPLDGRSGIRMWQRHAGAGAGATGFIVSIASYLYTFVLAAFGILLVLVKRPSTRAMLLLVILVAWPYAFLQGSRNIALAAVAPMFGGILLFTRINGVLKVAIMASGFVALDFAFRAVIAMRNRGFDLKHLDGLDQQRHLGLNMGSELIWISKLMDQEVFAPSWGARYFAEAVSMIPRVIWPGKPLIGIDYAIARGFGGGGGDIGVVATISTGMIGQGVVNFGMFVGPVAAAFLMALWCGVLYRLRLQGTVPRIALFLVGLGLTFNLGRDITTLVLFPFIFGYVAVRFLERRQKRRQRVVARSKSLAQAAMARRRTLPRSGVRVR